MAIDHQKALELFKQLDSLLEKSRQSARVVFLGGVAIILQGIRERSTLDFDIAPTPDAEVFAGMCRQMNIPVDIVTMVSTVDLAHCKTMKKFAGKNLVVETVLPEDLIKTKLERFTKQDPDDIYAIIDHMNLNYDEFKKIISAMLPDYVGRATPIKLSASEIVERKYSRHYEDFSKFIAPL